MGSPWQKQGLEVVVVLWCLFVHVDSKWDRSWISVREVALAAAMWISKEGGHRAPVHTVNNIGTSGCESVCVRGVVVGGPWQKQGLLAVVVLWCESGGWRMAHGGGSVSMCSRWSGDKCRHCVGTCGYQRPFCGLDVPGCESASTLTRLLSQA